MCLETVPTCESMYPEHIATSPPCTIRIPYHDMSLTYFNKSETNRIIIQNFDTIKENLEKYVTIYTDASKTEGAAAAAFYTKEGNSSDKLPESCFSYFGELLAICKAIAYSKSQKKNYYNSGVTQCKYSFTRIYPTNPPFLL